MKRIFGRLAAEQINSIERKTVQVGYLSPFKWRVRLLTINPALDKVYKLFSEIPNGSRMSSAGNTLQEVKTDIQLLLECMDYQKKSPSSLKQALITLSAILTANTGIKDDFRDSGGLRIVLDITTSTRYLEVTDAGLYCLASAVEGNVYSQKLLSTASTFTFLHGILSAVKESSVRRKQTAAYFLLCLVSSNNFGQNLMRQSHCLHDVMSLIRISLPKQLPTESKPNQTSEEGKSLDLWATLVSTASVCVNNPQNYENQRLCGSLFPYLFSILRQHRDHRVVRPILSLVGLTAADNVPNQDRVRKCGGLKLFVDLLRVIISNRPIREQYKTTAIQILGTLDTVITENEDNVQLVGELGGFGLTMNLLQEAELSDKDKTKAVVTLAHAVETDGSVQEYIVEDGGLACLIQQLTQTTNEELSKTVKYLLHLFVSSDKGMSAFSEDMFCIPSELEPFIETMEQMKRKNDTALLQKINDLDAKLRSMEKEALLRDFTDEMPDVSTDRKHQEDACEQQLHATNQLNKENTYTSVSGRSVEDSDNSQPWRENLISPREQSLLHQLNKEKRERCKLQKLNCMLQEDILLRRSADCIVSVPSNCTDGKLQPEQDQRQQSTTVLHHGPSVDQARAQVSELQQDCHDSLPGSEAGRHLQITQQKFVVHGVKNVSAGSQPLINMNENQYVQQQAHAPVKCGLSNNQGNILCNESRQQDAGTLMLKTHEPLDLSVHSSEEPVTGSYSFVVHRNNQLSATEQPQCTTDSNMNAMQIPAVSEKCDSVNAEGSSVVAEISKTIISGLMDMVKNIERFKDGLAGGDAGRLYDAEDDQQSMECLSAQSNNILTLNVESTVPDETGASHTESETVNMETNVSSSHCDTRNKHLSEISTSPNENLSLYETEPPDILSVTERGHAKVNEVYVPNSEEEPQLYFISDSHNKEHGKGQSEREHLKNPNSRGQKEEMKDGAKNKMIVSSEHFSTAGSISQILMPNKRCEHTPEAKTLETQVEFAGSRRQRSLQGAFRKPASVAPRRRVRITPLLGSNKMPDLKNSAVPSEICKSRGFSMESLDSNDTESMSESMSQFDSHLLQGIKVKEPCLDLGLQILCEKENNRLHSVSSLHSSSYGSEGAPAISPSKTPSQYSIKSIGRLFRSHVQRNKKSVPPHAESLDQLSSVGNETCLNLREANNNGHGRYLVAEKAVNFKSSKMKLPFNNSRCPGCVSPGVISGPILNSRTFNLSLETCPYSCEQHRKLRQLERQHIHNIRHVIKRKTVRKARLLNTVCASSKTGPDDPDVEMGISVYDFQSDSQSQQISSDTDLDSGSDTEMTNKAKSPRRARVPYTDQEIANLLQGVSRMGKFWNQILVTYKFHPSRTAVDLKDKYRKMQKQEKGQEATDKSSALLGRIFKPFSMCEERRLKRGVKKLGYNWKTILSTYTFLKGRTTTDLRNKWRQIHLKRHQKPE